MHLATIALGANIPSPAGPPEATLGHAADRLAALGRLVARSSLYSTAPVGFAHQPRFVNAAVVLNTQLSPRELLQALLHLELCFGRNREASPANGPRTLDLDILFYDDLVLGESGLEIPHPRLAERAFVLVPLQEIAPNLRDPRSGKSVTEMLGSLTSRSDRNAVIQLDWSGWSAFVERS